MAYMKDFDPNSTKRSPAPKSPSGSEPVLLVTKHAAYTKKLGQHLVDALNNKTRKLPFPRAGTSDFLPSSTNLGGNSFR